MSFDELEAFLTFAEELNFTRAAERLAISQPALHVKVQKISGDLNQVLYLKEGRNLTLTSHGVQLEQYARETLRRNQEFRVKLRGGSPDEPVAFCAGTGSYLYLLGAALKDFNESHPGKLELMTADREATLSHLRTGKVQLGVTVLSSKPKDLECELLCSIPAKLVLPKGHPLERKSKPNLKSLSQVPLIVPPNGKPFRELLESFFNKHKADLTVALEANGWELMLHFAELEFAATIVNGCCLIPDSCRGVELKELPTADYYLVHRNSKYLTANALRLKDCLLSLFCVE